MEDIAVVSAVRTPIGAYLGGECRDGAWHYPARVRFPGASQPSKCGGGIAVAAIFERR